MLFQVLEELARAMNGEISKTLSGRSEISKDQVRLDRTLKFNICLAVVPLLWSGSITLARWDYKILLFLPTFSLFSMLSCNPKLQAIGEKFYNCRQCEYLRGTFWGFLRRINFRIIWWDGGAIWSVFLLLRDVVIRTYKCVFSALRKLKIKLGNNKYILQLIFYFS